MSELDEAQLLVNHIKDHAPVNQHNRKMLCILEGDLLKFVEAHLATELSGQSLEDALSRVAPINFFRRIIDKLSKIYQQQPQRRIVDGTDKDQELLDWYIQKMQFDANMNVGNEFFNTFKTNLNQIFLNVDGNPDLRPIQNDMFWIWSDNKIDRTRPTHIILPFGMQTVSKIDQYKRIYQKQVDIFRVYTDEQIRILDSEGDWHTDPNNPEAINPFGTIGNFMYVNRSKHRLNPPIDSDSFRMSVLLPVLISDLNFAVKYLAFSIVYGIDVDDENLKRSPNAFWHLKSDPTSDTKPEVGQIKPQIDIEAAMQLIISQLSMWLNSKNIRPGSVSDISAENMVSGISKLVDEMDTSDERKKQVESYKAAEEKFWLDVMHKVHPVWVQNGEIANEGRFLFSQNAKVEVSFPEQLPLMSRASLVDSITKELQAGLISRVTAISKLNPDWSDMRIEEEIASIDGGAVVVEPVEDEVEPEQETPEETE
jgi:hypothetical protein